MFSCVSREDKHMPVHPLRKVLLKPAILPIVQTIQQQSQQPNTQIKLEIPITIPKHPTSPKSANQKYFVNFQQLQPSQIQIDFKSVVSHFEKDSLHSSANCLIFQQQNLPKKQAPFGITSFGHLLDPNSSAMDKSFVIKDEDQIRCIYEFMPIKNKQNSIKGLKKDFSSTQFEYESTQSQHQSSSEPQSQPDPEPEPEPESESESEQQPQPEPQHSSQTQQQESEPEAKQQSSTCQNLNEQFSKNMILRNYNESYELLEKMNEYQLNSHDSKGFTPIHLTTLLSISRENETLHILKTLLKNKMVNPAKKSTYGTKPIEQAILFKNIPTLTNIFQFSYLHKIKTLKKTLKQFEQILQSLPDMCLQLYLKVGSFVPFIGTLAPDDTIKIFKKGKNLRIDYSLVGYSFMKSKRRQMSCIIQKLSQSDYTILAVNHDKKCYSDLLEALESEQIILMIQDLLSLQIKRTNPNINNTFINKSYNIFNQLVKEQMVVGMSIKHELKVIYTSKTQKLEPRTKNAQQQLGYLQDWEAYSKYICKQNHKVKQKQLKIGMWLCEKCPLSFDHLIVLMKFFSFCHETGEILYNFLSDEKVKQKITGFPSKIEIPMNFSLFLDVQVSGFTLDPGNIQFDYIEKYKKVKRSEYQKTLIRKQKRVSILKFFT